MKSDHYTAAGVNIDAADDLIDRIKPLAAATRIAGATEGLGGFGGVFDLARAGFGDDAPQLVAGTDGVGTKLKVAFAADKHDTIGIDCVAMCVNDILAMGATPLFFLDYFATGVLRPEVGEAVVRGIAEGCKQAGCWLLGGETAEMPGMYADGEYDLAGFVVGAIRDADRIDPTSARAGDVVLGVRSSGLHSNGFSLARRVLLDDGACPLDTPLGDDSLPLGKRMLVPTRIYVKAVRAVLDAGVTVKALAHITGGGLWENPQRSLPEDLGVAFDLAALRSMSFPIYEEISRRGGVPEREMYRVFNMGVGLTLTVSPDAADAALAALSSAGEVAALVGEVVSTADGAGRIRIEGVSDAPIAS